MGEWQPGDVAHWSSPTPLTPYTFLENEKKNAPQKYWNKMEKKKKGDWHPEKKKSYMVILLFVFVDGLA